MFDDIIFAKKPIYSFIDELRSKTDVSFFYGTRDWMNLKVQNDTPISNEIEALNIPVYYVDDASHHIYFRNPE